MPSNLTSSGTDLSQVGAQAPNPLDDFQSFNNLFTLAGCTKSQVNGTSIKKSDIDNIICKSASIGPDGGVDTAFGKFDYFIDDVNLVTIPRNSDKTGNSFASKLSFKVFEPYSMGLFMLALRTAGEKSGYDLNFKEAPFVFMIEWVGYINGVPSYPADELTRIIPIKIIDVKFKVGVTGSQYDVEAIPYNEFGYREQAVRHVSDVQISGSKVEDLLSLGPTSLYNQLQTRYEVEKQTNHIEDLDEYEIQFPDDFLDEDGSDNEISKATVYLDFNNSGTQPMSQVNAKSIWFDDKQIYRSAPFKLESDRTAHFTQEISIPDIINEIVIRSDYIVKQIVGNQIQTDENGMVKWFRIDCRIKDGDNVQQMGRQKRTIIYRVVPYKVHIHRFLPPGEKPKVGFDNLKKTVSRVYNYIYTGQNTEILNIEIGFDMAFFTPIPSDASNRVGQSNPGQKGITAGGKEVKNVFSPSGLGVGPLNLPASPTVPFFAQGQQLMNSLTKPSQNLSMPNVPPVNLGATQEIDPVAVEAAQRQFYYRPYGGSGTDDFATSQVRTMQMLLTNPGDMLNLTMEIMGDPYYIPTSGMGSQAVERGQGNRLQDGAMNYQDSEVMIIINFRTPIDLDPATGLYKFDQSIDMWSGLYQVIQVESRFNGNKFTQVVQGIRLRAQLGKEADTIFLEQKDESGGAQGS